GWRRISRIADLIGDETVQAVVDEVRQELSKDDPRTWEIFWHGDEATQRAVQEEANRDMSNEKDTQSDRPDWTWIERETEMHRQGQCSVRQASEMNSSDLDDNR